MDISEYTRIIFDKLQKFEQQNATKIMGYLLLQDHGEQEMVKLASYPDHLIREVAFKARNELQRLAAKSAILPISLPPSPQQDLRHLLLNSPVTPTSPASFRVSSPYCDPRSASNTNTRSMAMSYSDSVAEFQKQAQLFGLENHVDVINSGTAGIASRYHGLDASLGNLHRRTGRRFSSLSEFPVKTCHYFNKGYCKHGDSCRYYHGQVVPEVLPQMYGNDGLNHDQAISPGSLAQLESEIIELLKPRRGEPISIATLPLAYNEKYNKVLQAEGYLTESQRHGKSGYSLTRLLARLKNIRVIDRPHGQHAVVLAEDAPKFMGKGESGKNISASRQIYLTFPADSTFIEEDVSNYFNTFGSVEDVRIPCQQRRMFGFVTFVDPETVKMILEKGNPHSVRGSRVLVKPYVDNSKLIDRKYRYRIEHPGLDLDSELKIPRNCGNNGFLRRLLTEEQTHEFQRRRIAELQLSQNPLSNSPRLGFNMGEIKVLDYHLNFQTIESFNYVPNDKAEYTNANKTDEDSSEALNLPDSPFEFPIDSRISAVT